MARRPNRLERPAKWLAARKAVIGEPSNDFRRVKYATTVVGWEGDGDGAYAAQGF
jgi:hypothetical protein